MLISSVERGDHGERGWPTLCSPPYTVSKIALNALTEIQQREFDQDPREDLVVNAVHPGFIVTDMTLNQGALTTEEGKKKRLKFYRNPIFKIKNIYQVPLLQHGWLCYPKMLKSPEEATCG